MRVILSAATVALLSVRSRAQTNTDRCLWQTWEESDWPGEDQDFREIVGDAYFDSQDFEEGERFENYASWETLFWERPDYYRPLGFYKADRLEPDNEYYPCFEIQGAGGHKVELMLETFQKDAAVKVVDLDKSGYYRQEEGNVDGTGAGQYYHCFTADTRSASVLNIGVICENNCDESYIDMLWRVRRSSLTWSESGDTPDTNVDMWCNMIASQISWPSDIQEGTPEEVEEGKNSNLNSAMSHSVGFMVAAVMAIAGLIAA